VSASRRQKAPPETALLKPVLDLFPEPKYQHQVEVPLGRRRIDVVFVPTKTRKPWIAVELKIKDWWKAAWQANINFQLAEQSYIAVWHNFIHLPARHMDILDSYGIGLIEVYEDSAVIVRKSVETRKVRTRSNYRAISFA